MRSTQSKPTQIPMAFSVFAENLTRSLEPMLASYSQSLLQKISDDYNLSYAELSSRYLTGPVAPPPKAKKKVVLPQCSGMTAKGGQCQHKAFDESGLCRVHQKKTGEATVTKTKKVKKPVKEPAPNHTHEPSESDPLCGLCESHGNPVDPKLPSTQFEASDDLANRLKALIMAEGEPEEPEEPEVESDYEDEGEALTQALRNMVLEE